MLFINDYINKLFILNKMKYQRKDKGELNYFT